MKRVVLFALGTILGFGCGAPVDKEPGQSDDGGTIGEHPPKKDAGSSGRKDGGHVDTTDDGSSPDPVSDASLDSDDSSPGLEFVSVITQHNDFARTGANLRETI